MFRKKPKVPLPDFGDKPIGMWIMELEKKGLMGHFKENLLFSSFDSDGGGVCITRDYWIMAGTDPISTFKFYLGNEKKIINSIDEALLYIKEVIDSLSDKLQEIIKTTNSDLLLRKLISLFNVTYDIYRRDRKTRENLVENSWNSPTNTYEKNRNITLTILNGLNLMIENCALFHNDVNNYCGNVDITCFDELIDVNLLVKIYVYSLASQYYTLLNVSKRAKNYKYCSGIIISPNEDIPIEGIIAHPLVYTNTMLAGNIDALLPSDEKEYLKSANLTEIGKGFKASYDIEFTEVMNCFYSFKKNLCEKNKALAEVITEKQLREYMISWYPNVNIDKFLKHFVLTKEILEPYASEAEPYIYKMGCNKNRLEIRPVVKLSNGSIYTSYAILDKAMNMWYSYLINGGRPYTSVEPGEGDCLIDGCSKREEELGKVIMVNILLEIIEKHFPTATFKDTDVDYDKIFGNRSEDYGDFDIIYYVGNELYLIESKYFSDSYTGNTIIGDYNKLFARKDNYYKHCRGRYDLVINEPHAMKKYIGAIGNVNAHFLFISSKPLEVEFQDEDKIVTFLSIANFEKYLKGELIAEDGTLLRPTHNI